MATSASQVKRIRECERMWAFDWQDTSPDKWVKGPAAIRGDAIHEIARSYHVKGVYPGDDEYGLIFKSGLHYMPRPLCGRAEGHFNGRISGQDYSGFIDLECTVGDLPPCPATEGVDPSIPVVIDYKSVTSLTSRYGFNGLEGPGQFLNDPQALLYGLKVLIQRPEAKQVWLRWIYLQAEGKKKAVCQDVLLHRKEVEECFGNIVHAKSVRLVKLKLSKPDPKSLPPTPSRCMKYGEKYPCKHIAKCALTAQELLLGDPEDNMAKSGDLLAELEAQFGGEDTKPAPKQEAIVPASKGINPPESKTQVMPTKVLYDNPGDAAIGAAFMTLLRAIRSVF